MILYCFTEEEGLRVIGISGVVEDFVEHLDDYEFTEPEKIAREIAEEYKN